MSDDIVDRLYRLDADHCGVINGLGEGAREIERLRAREIKQIEAEDRVHVENHRLRAIVKAYEEGVEATLEVIHAIKETDPPGPQVYRWGWQDACEKIEEAIRNNAIGGGDGIVREMALAPEVKDGIGP